MMNYEKVVKSVSRSGWGTLWKGRWIEVDGDVRYRSTDGGHIPEPGETVQRLGEVGRFQTFLWKSSIGT